MAKRLGNALFIIGLLVTAYFEWVTIHFGTDPLWGGVVLGLVPVFIGGLCAYILRVDLPDAIPDPRSAEAKAEWYAALCGSPAVNIPYDYEWSRKALNEWKAKYKAPHPPNINL